MAITVRDPNRVFLGGPRPTIVNEFAAKEAITPGMLCDLDNAAGVHTWKKAATAKAPTTSVALDQLMFNKSVSSTPASDTAWAALDLIEVGEMAKGAAFWSIIASGANIAFGDKLENAGNGKLRAWTDASQAFRALETKDNSGLAADARLRVEVL